MKPQKKTILKLFCLLFTFLVIGLIISSTTTVLADAGNNNRYETTSGSDYYSDGDSGLFNILIYFMFELFGPIPGLIILLIGYIVYRRLKKQGKLKNIEDAIKNANRPNQPVDNYVVDRYQGMSNDEVINKVKELDPNFSSDAFTSWAKEVFVRIQQAWTDRNWKVIRPFESNELFNQHNLELQEYIKNNKINVIEKINVNYTTFRDFRVDGDKEVLVLELHAVMRDYVIDATTKKVLESDPNRDWDMKYLMTFIRKKGVTTKVGTSNKSTTNCPNCGAPTEITSAGQCEYCDTVITTGEHDWVLNDIHSIR